MSDERDVPTGGFVEVLRTYDRRCQAVERHAAAEGHPTDTMEILDSYDRALHPWMYGRRPTDLLARLKAVFNR